MDLDQLFVHNLRKYRKIRELSQKTLAERCNAAHSYIRQIESGKGKPSFDFIKKLCIALEIDAYQLFYDETMMLGDKPLYVNDMTKIKENFLSAVEKEFDKMIDQIKR